MAIYQLGNDAPIIPSSAYVAKEAVAMGRGGVKAMHELTGMSRPTILKGMRELAQKLPIHQFFFRNYPTYEVPRELIRVMAEEIIPKLRA